MPSPAAASLALLLNTTLSQDSKISNILGSCKHITEAQLIRSAIESGDPNSASVIHRWTLRLQSLLNSTHAKARYAGLNLALVTGRQSQTVLFGHGKEWLASCSLFLLRRNQHNPAVICSALRLGVFVFSSSIGFPEFSREVCNAQAVQHFVNLLVSCANERELLQVVSDSLAGIAKLLPLFSTALRPVVGQVTTLASDLLIHPSASVSSRASSLLSVVFVTGGRSGANASWVRTVESLVGSLDLLLDDLLGPLLVEDPVGLPAERLPPLAMQTSFVSQQEHPIVRITPLLSKCDRLVDTLITMLATPTERAPSVPLGQLVRLGWRFLVNGTPRSPVDAEWQSASTATGAHGRLRVCGARLLAQAAFTTHVHFAPYSTITLDLLSSKITNETNHSTRQSLCGAVVAVATSGPLNPTETRKAMEPVISSILEDLSMASKMYTTNVVLPAPTGKRSKLYEGDQVWSRRQTRDASLDLLAGQALSNLELLLNNVAHLLARTSLVMAIRLLLSLSLAAGFATSSSVRPATSHKLVERLPRLRLSLVSCLLVALRTAGREAAGLADSLSTVFVACVNSSDPLLHNVGVKAMATLSLLSHPRMPPAFLGSMHLEEETELLHGLSTSDDIVTSQEMQANGTNGPGQTEAPATHEYTNPGATSAPHEVSQLSAPVIAPSLVSPIKATSTLPQPLPVPASAPTIPSKPIPDQGRKEVTVAEGMGVSAADSTTLFGRPLSPGRIQPAVQGEKWGDAQDDDSSSDEALPRLYLGDSDEEDHGMEVDA